MQQENVPIKFTTRTIERDIAYLQNHDIIKREGGRKDGYWKVIGK